VEKLMRTCAAVIPAKLISLSERGCEQTALITAGCSRHGFRQPALHPVMTPHRMTLVSFYNMMTNGVGVTAKFLILIWS